VTTASERLGFVVRCRSAGEGAVVLAPRGELDLATAPLLEQAVLAQASDARRVVVDLRKLSFIDSSGLRTLVHLTRWAHEDERELAFVRAGPRVHRVFELSGIAGVLAFTDPPLEP
jgi:anti-sigma B factor antagonist